MIFKYYPTNRFFENGLVRFTQPGALNDPDDARPELIFGKYTAEDYRKAYAQAAQYGDTPPSKDDLENLYMDPFPSGRMDEKSFPGLWPATDLRLREEPFYSVAELDKAVAEKAIELLNTEADKHFGVFSLSESTQEQMWAYYANDHQGISVGLDENHPYFKGMAKKIIYTDEPYYISSNKGWIRVGGVTINTQDVLNGRIKEIPADLFQRKRMGWHHEREWRMILPLSQAKETRGADHMGFSINLYEIPSESVLCLYFGFRSSEAFVETTLRIIKLDRKWNNLKIYRRTIDIHRRISSIQIS